MADDKTGAPGNAARTPKGTSAAGRQDGNYTVKITGAKGGPIPAHRPFGDEPAAPEPDSQPNQ
jgi:hypothetical protein